MPLSGGVSALFDDDFAHYLSYGATDQRTALDLAGNYTGLLVPGTIAAFQREGTGGFVLSLSATAAAPDYTIDPRFPLFQQPLPSPKRSHVALAELLDAPELVRGTAPSPADFTPDLIARIAAAWGRFNGGYQDAAGSKFAKYAKRLKREVMPRDAREPTYVLAPYLVASGPTDPWWAISEQLFEATLDAMNGDQRCIRVVAAASAGALAELIPATSERRLAMWVSGLEEMASPSQDLAAYGRAIQTAASEGRSSFALYGGFFSVLLHEVGLRGSSHGIGYGEYRNWIELPNSGPPPARYYLPQLHRYVQADEATRLHLADPRLAECLCDECQGDPPLGLDYHSLMKHSVRCRAAEIDGWAGLDPDAAATRLSDELEAYRQVLQGSGLPDIVVTRTERQASHIPVWIEALRII